jgi:ribosome-associated protein
MDKKVHFKLREGEAFIPLVQLLKISQLAGSGGEAQMLVLDGSVRLNGAVELRKRAKIRSGDRVTTFGVEITIE